ncbi:hypothetical protein Trco_001106 [Trichoderma cornu-damae]|uniref:Uncharacterized protein n=1 Tax=Trichoderma cornu-damae TaxID=654480 RepID=A0A9P8QTD6_9HYPO|nr:hypothetical protein Trco_001106 [Trichoderma cornu-damae]
MFPRPMDLYPYENPHFYAIDIILGYLNRGNTAPEITYLSRVADAWCQEYPLHDDTLMGLDEVLWAHPFLFDLTILSFSRLYTFRDCGGGGGGGGRRSEQNTRLGRRAAATLPYPSPHVRPFITAQQYFFTTIDAYTLYVGPRGRWFHDRVVAQDLKGSPIIYYIPEVIRRIAALSAGEMLTSEFSTFSPKTSLDFSCHLAKGVEIVMMDALPPSAGFDGDGDPGGDVMDVDDDGRYDAPLHLLLELVVRGGALRVVLVLVFFVRRGGFLALEPNRRDRVLEALNGQLQMQLEGLVLRLQLLDLALGDHAALLHHALHGADAHLVLLQALFCLLGILLALAGVRDGNLQHPNLLRHGGDLGVALGGRDVVLVDLGAGADALGLVGVAKRRQRLVVVRGADAGDHGRLAVAAQGVLEQPRQDGVSVGHHVLPLARPQLLGAGQRGDDPAEGGERLVDVAALAEPRAGGLGRLCPLASGQVDQADAGAALRRLVRLHVVVDLLEHDGEDGVAPAAGVVHLGAGHGAGCVAHLHVAHDLVDVPHGHFGQVLDVGPLGGGLADLEVVGRRAGDDGHQEVSDVLVVDLEIRDPDVVGDAGVLVVGGVYALEQILASPGDQPGVLGRPHHGVALAGARLAVGEDARVVALEVVVEELFAEAVVDVFLGGVVLVVGVVAPERAVKGKALVAGDLAGLGRAREGGFFLVGGPESRHLGDWVHFDEASGSAFDFYITYIY